MPQQSLPHPRRWANHHRRLALALLATGALVRLVPNPLDAARAQQATTLNGPPVQVVPYVAEPGVPMVTIDSGTPNPFPSPDGATGNGADGDGGVTGDSTALGTMAGTAWGSKAIANAQSLGVNATALAATCVLESGCQNTDGPGAQGVFQMFPAAYNEGLQTALAANPALASQIIPGNAGMNGSPHDRHPGEEGGGTAPG